MIFMPEGQYEGKHEGLVVVRPWTTEAAPVITDNHERTKRMHDNSKKQNKNKNQQ